MVRIKQISEYEYTVFRCQSGPDVRVGKFILHGSGKKFLFVPKGGASLCSNDMLGLNKHAQQLDWSISKRDRHDQD